ncbi:MAG: aminotransferase class I/II-fold pyridoxal phosphate-dependent enzyme [Gemmatimonadetes bacterium]|nr:aminotransferase class I/II-fold pyridoxal phosphate-dependent enzyme [Gemmatimonadota bacterium]
MRAAIADAEVGDDALGDDPTVHRLEGRVAALLGKERALFFPSGIMANETAIVVLGRPGTEAVVDASCHLLDWEEGAAAAWAGMQLREVATPPAGITAAAVEAALRADSPYQPRTSLISVENTHNAAGGKVVPLDRLKEIRSLAEDRGLPVHMDGARLWNASTASGVTVAEYAATADTVMVTLSKGLGCPVGSMLAGDGGVMREAWRIRRRMGGAMRQAGILAAAGLYALDHHVDLLAEDHRRAGLLAELLADVRTVRVEAPETNIVMIDLLRADVDAPTVVAQLAGRGVRMSPFSPRRLRAVTHMDVDDDGIRLTARALAEVLTVP